MLRAIILVLVLTAVGVAGYVGVTAYEFLFTAPETPGREVTVFIEPGMKFDEVAETLYRAGLVRDPRMFRLLARVTDKGGKVKAGEFALDTGLPPLPLLDALVAAKPILHRLSVPEGLTMRQVAKIVEEAGFGPAREFIKAATNPEMLKKYAIPADSAEGFLFPETYMLTRRKDDEPAAVVEAMLKEFRRRIGEVWPGKPLEGKALFEAVTLASIVEKESGQASERPRVAGVFLNRMAKGMLLQTDPTIIYGLGERFDGNLTRAHLEDPTNRYNTYAHPGLPPGPICSPGLAALKAVAAPEIHNYFYFVSNGQGEHVFSTTLDDHNTAVNKFQRRRQGQKKEARP